MDNQPPFDRGILLPIGVGIISLIGLCIILVVGRITAARANVQEVPTATSFKYALVGTEPAITTVTFEATEAEIVTLTPSIATALPPATPNVLLPTSTIVPLVTVSPGANTTTPTRTPTTASSAPLNSGTYDDLDNRLIYGGDWTPVSGAAYQNTLHVSDTLGDTINFLFIGQELRVFFQAGPSLGVIGLTLDGTSYTMDQSNASTQTYEWVLPSVTNGTHTVTITHLSGGSVNLNYIIIPEVPVTPTKTATSTL